MNNDEIVRIFVDSKNGNINAQKTIFNLMKEYCHPLVLAFYPNVKKLGIDYSDLEDLTIEALFNIYKNVDSSEIFDFKNLCKFYFLKAVQNEIRYRTINSRNVYSNTLSFDNPEQNVELMLAQQSRYDCDDLRDAISKKSIYDDAIIQNNAKLTLKERQIIILFLNDITVKEISKKLNLTYQTVYKHIRNSLKKAKTFIETKYKDEFNFL